MKNVAVVLAGGVGSRMGMSVPKQFLTLAGRRVVEYSVDAFDAHEGIDEVAIVSHTDHMREFERMMAANRWHKVRKLLTGGAERYHSSLSAIRAYEGEEADAVNLIFHDAARPLVSRRIIGDVVSALQTYRAVCVAIPSADTIVEVDDNRIVHIPDRNRLRRAQTPQGFRLAVIGQAYRIALGDPAFRATDDCGVVVRYLPDVPVGIVPGEESNMKLTYKEDLALLEDFLRLRAGDEPCA